MFGHIFTCNDSRTRAPIIKIFRQSTERLFVRNLNLNPIFIFYVSSLASIYGRTLFSYSFSYISIFLSCWKWRRHLNGRRMYENVCVCLVLIDDVDQLFFRLTRFRCSMWRDIFGCLNNFSHLPPPPSRLRRAAVAMNIQRANCDHEPLMLRCQQRFADAIEIFQRLHNRPRRASSSVVVAILSLLREHRAWERAAQKCV